MHRPDSITEEELTALYFQQLDEQGHHSDPSQEFGNTCFESTIRNGTSLLSKLWSETIKGCEGPVQGVREGLPHFWLLLHLPGEEVPGVVEAGCATDAS